MRRVVATSRCPRRKGDGAQSQQQDQQGYFAASFFFKPEMSMSAFGGKADICDRRPWCPLHYTPRGQRHPPPKQRALRRPLSCSPRRPLANAVPSRPTVGCTPIASAISGLRAHKLLKEHCRPTPQRRKPLPLSIWFPPKSCNLASFQRIPVV